jgi:hypothetical protein
MVEEGMIEQSMDFVILPSMVQPVTAMAVAHGYVPSTEEREMWDDHALSNEVFDAGVDHTAAAVNERRRLEQEATNFDLWHGTDLIPEEDPNNGELLLDELEQDDILTELLRNARMYYLIVPDFRCCV